MSMQSYHAEVIAERPAPSNFGHCRACGKNNVKGVAAITDCCGAGPCYSGQMQYTDATGRSVMACCLNFAKDNFRCAFGDDPKPGFFAKDVN